MAKLTSYTVALLFGGEISPDDEVAKEGRWPLCHSCGQKRADLYWTGALEGRASRGFPPRDTELVFCYDCVATVCGGLMVDLLLENQQTEAALYGDMRRRYRKTQFCRVHQVFPDISDNARRLLADPHGRAFLVAAAEGSGQVRRGLEEHYHIVPGVARLGGWLQAFHSESVGAFDEDFEYIEFLLGMDLYPRSPQPGADWMRSYGPATGRDLPDSWMVRLLARGDILEIHHCKEDSGGLAATRPGDCVQFEAGYAGDFFEILVGLPGYPQDHEVAWESLEPFKIDAGVLERHLDRKARAALIGEPNEAR